MSAFSKNPVIVYSIDDEFYNTFEQTRDELHELDCTVQDVVVYEGLSHHPRHSEFINVDLLIADMLELCTEEYGEFGGDYLYSLTQNDIHDLKNTLVSWFNKNVPQPTFYRAFNIKESEEDFTDG